MDDSKKAAKEAIKGRAMFYLHMYRTLEQELGPERSREIMRKAIYRWGQEKAAKCPAEARVNPRVMAEEFIKGGQGMLMVFGNEVVEAGNDGAILRLNACPLVEAWKEAGLEPSEIALMCDMAYAVDFGKYEGLGYILEFPCRIFTGGNYCQLNLQRKA